MRILVSIFLVFLAVNIVAKEPNQQSAWDWLLGDQPTALKHISPLEVEVLQLLTVEDAQRLKMNQAALKDITLMNGQPLVQFLEERGIPELEIPSFTIDNGGDTLSGGEFTLTGIAGQPDTGLIQGGEFQMSGGFLPGALSTTSGLIFRDGFESGNTLSWTNSSLRGKQGVFQ